jgi:type III pantothenate kinase
MSLLALDIGNTRLKWALYERAGAGEQPVAHGAEFLENIDKLADGPWSGLQAPARMIGCCVAADAIKRRAEGADGGTVGRARPVGGRQFGRGRRLQRLRPPDPLGADRWVAMIGARARMLAEGAARPMVVVMVGTAVTVEALDAEGRFLGGFILPGHGIMLRALESGTAGLHVPTGEVREFPTNTSDALTSGGTFAIAGAIERMVQHVRGTAARAACFMTGGAGWKMAPHMSVQFELVESLIFDGLLVIAQSGRA